jgi:uncharacterized protein (DUF4213/DUF364 family)
MGMAQARNDRPNLIDGILSVLPDGECLQVCIGMHWTAVVLDVAGERRCGLASSLNGNHDHGEPDVLWAGSLETMSGLALAGLIRDERLAMASVGAAAINALLPRNQDQWETINAEEVIARHGEGKTVVLVGHFPFISRLRSQVGELIVLEQRPQPGDVHANLAGEVIPKAGVVAITGTTLINHTLTELLSLCSPEATVILLGPSAFLSPVMFEYGIDLLCGSVVTDIEAVIKTIMQGGNFRQVHLAGVKLVSMSRLEWTPKG